MRGVFWVQSKKVKEHTKDKEIYFYRICLQKFVSGGDFKNVEDLSTELVNVFEIIKNLSRDHSLENNIYMDIDSKKYYYMDIEDITTDFIRGKIISSSSDIYPSIENSGNLSSLQDKLPKGSKLADITHFVVFIKKGIIGVEYNNKGVRPTTIAKYVTTKLLPKYYMSFVNIVNKSTVDKLKEIKKVKSLEIKLDKSSIVSNNVVGGELFSAFDNAEKMAKNVLQDDNLMITINLQSKKGFYISEQLKNWLMFFKKENETIKRNSEKIVIKGISEDDENLNFDLVKQVIKAPKIAVLVNKNNEINSDDIYTKIIALCNKYN